MRSTLTKTKKNPKPCTSATVDAAKLSRLYTTFPLFTARTQQSLDNFLAQYLATELDDRIL